jgi:hypothetical protein
MTWYYAHMKWAVMAERRGLLRWEESVLLFRASDREAAFQIALQLGTKGEQGRLTSRGWVEKRFAEILAMDELCDGEEIELRPKPADRSIPFEHQFQPEQSTPQPAF